jgi:hypothetical protein
MRTMMRRRMRRRRRMRMMRTRTREWSRRSKPLLANQEADSTAHQY